MSRLAMSIECGNMICRNSSSDVLQDEGITADEPVITCNSWRHNARDACYRNVNSKTLCNSASEPDCHKPLVAGASSAAASFYIRGLEPKGWHLGQK